MKNEITFTKHKFYRMKYFSIVVFFAATFFLASCQRIDNNLYNSQKVEQYFQDDYNGEVDFTLDDTYKLANTRKPKNPFPILLYSQASIEKQPTYISAYYLGILKNISKDTIILYCHGNKSHMDFYWPRAKLLANVNGLDTVGYKGKGGMPKHFGVLYFDYRGFGNSKGKPSEEGMYADVNAALSWLKSRGAKESNLIMYGFSLGCAPVCKIASDGGDMRPSKIILEAPFASAEAMVQDASALNMPSSFYTDLKIDNSEKIKNVKQPLMWIHGTNDDFLEMETHGQLVYDNYGGADSNKIAYKIAGAGHSNIETTWGFGAYNKAVLDFIRGKH